MQDDIMCHLLPFSREANWAKKDKDRCKVLIRSKLSLYINMHCIVYVLYYVLLCIVEINNNLEKIAICFKLVRVMKSENCRVL